MTDTTNSRTAGGAVAAGRDRTGQDSERL